MTLEESGLYGNIIEVYDELYRTLDNNPGIASKLMFLKEDIELLKSCADELFLRGRYAATQGEE